MIPHPKLKTKQVNQQQQKPIIQGRKINNILNCNSSKNIKKLNNQLKYLLVPQQTFQTDSFKELLSKRSAKIINKQNNNAMNKSKGKSTTNLNKIQQQKINNQYKKKYKKDLKQNSQSIKNLGKKTKSLIKLTKKIDNDYQIQYQKRKSYSPHHSKSKSHRSLYNDKKNYVSNYNSKTNRDINNNYIKQKSQKIIIDKLVKNTKSQQKQYKDNNNSNKQKIIKKNNKKKYGSKNNLYYDLKKQQLNSKTQSLAKQFDIMLRGQQKKNKKKKCQKRQKIQKKIIISQNNSKLPNNKKIQSNQNSINQYDSQLIPLSSKFPKQRNKTKQRLSLNQKKKKIQKSIKTQCLSPQTQTIKNNQNKQSKRQYKINKKLTKQQQSAIKIQKIFRGYLTRKYLNQYKRVIKAVIDIQRVWRGYKARKQVRKMKRQKLLQITGKLQRINKRNQSSEDQDYNSSRRLLKHSPQKVHEILQNSLLKANNQQIQKWTQILQQILYQGDVDQRIKQKIINFLQRQQSKNTQKKSIQDQLVEAQIKSQKRYLQKKRLSIQNPSTPRLLCSPDLQIQQPSFLVDNLIIFQKIHKQKLIKNANIKKQDISNLLIQKIYSPRTCQLKKKQIDQRLINQIQKFDAGINQVLRSCQEQQYLQIMYTPQRIQHIDNNFNLQNSQDKILKLKSIQKNKQKIHQNRQLIKFHDMSVQISSYFSQKTPQNNQFQPFDNSFQFVQQYLLSLIQYLRNQQNGQYRKIFLKKMNQYKNLGVDIILKNLPVITQDSQQDITFKLPLYKYLQNQQLELIDKFYIQQFNNYYKKLQRHQFNRHRNLQQIYIKMIIDCMNQALNIQRPTKYIFTQKSLQALKKPKLKQFQFQTQNTTYQQSLFSYYFANSMNTMYKWASTLCGCNTFIQAPAGQIKDQDWMVLINQARMKQMINLQSCTEWVSWDQLIQVIVQLSQSIFQEIVIEQGATLYF